MTSSASAPTTVAELDQIMSEPSEGAIEAVRQCPGDLVVLGAGGKIGFHLCLMLRRCLEGSGPGGERKIVAVSRFRSPESRQRFEEAGIETAGADLNAAGEVGALPEAANVFFLAGVKFGTEANADLLNQTNIVLPGLVAERYAQSRIVAFSTGCVYSFTTPASGGSREESGEDEMNPPGEYAKSCLGRERAFFDAAREKGVRSSLVRLNYAIDLRYGVLVDIAQKVLAGEPVNVETGYVNLIWQGDAVDQVVQCLPRASAPPFVVNVTGGEALKVRDLAGMFGRRLGCEPLIEGEEAPTAWLSDVSRARKLFGEPRVDLETMVEWVASWLEGGGETLDKPTRFETRDGKY